MKQWDEQPHKVHDSDDSPMKKEAEQHQSHHAHWCSHCCRVSTANGPWLSAGFAARESGRDGDKINMDDGTKKAYPMDQARMFPQKPLHSSCHAQPSPISVESEFSLHAIADPQAKEIAKRNNTEHAAMRATPAILTKALRLLW